MDNTACEEDTTEETMQNARTWESRPAKTKRAVKETITGPVYDEQQTKQIGTPSITVSLHEVEHRQGYPPYPPIQQTTATKLHLWAFLEVYMPQTLGTAQDVSLIDWHWEGNEQTGGGKREKAVATISPARPP